MFRHCIGVLSTPGQGSQGWWVEDEAAPKMNSKRGPLSHPDPCFSMAQGDHSFSLSIINLLILSYHSLKGPSSLTFLFQASYKAASRGCCFAQLQGAPLMVPKMQTLGLGLCLLEGTFGAFWKLHVRSTSKLSMRSIIQP